MVKDGTRQGEEWRKLLCGFIVKHFWHFFFKFFLDAFLKSDIVDFCQVDIVGMLIQRLIVFRPSATQRACSGTFRWGSHTLLANLQQAHQACCDALCEKSRCLMNHLKTFQFLLLCLLISFCQTFFVSFPSSNLSRPCPQVWNAHSLVR